VFIFRVFFTNKSYKNGHISKFSSSKLIAILLTVTFYHYYLVCENFKEFKALLEISTFLFSDQTQNINKRLKVALNKVPPPSNHPTLEGLYVKIGAINFTTGRSDGRKKISL